MEANDSARDDLERWRSAKASNYFDRAPHLSALLEGLLPARRWQALEPRLRDFGAVVVDEVEPAVQELEAPRNAPVHRPYDDVGRRIEEISFHPLYATVGRAVWGAGLLACNVDGDGALEQAALFYLLSHVGEGGHACPAVCTAGLIRGLERRASPELAARYLGRLRASDYDQCLRGSQFLTEVQGGSDVGANACTAVPDPSADGAWRITGEKWFCSVADADLFAVTARPASGARGTRGLGCFLVPRTLDAAPNGFRIRRLKDKFGTRCMASAEIDFDGALGWPIGHVDEGFHVAVEELLNTSRLLNALGSTGLMRRAYVEALTFAQHRSAFGRPIIDFATLRQLVASMKLDEHAALALTLHLAELRERIDADRAGDEERAAFRILVNANKFATSICATDVVHRGIEVLGGNGTIEDFSPLPRLYRDAVVYESWEGTHNVLCAQVLRDLSKPELCDGFFSWARSFIGGSGIESVASSLAEREAAIRTLVAGNDPRDAVRFRTELLQLVRVHQAAALARTSAPELHVAAEVLARAAGGEAVDAPADADRVLAGDLG